MTDHQRGDKNEVFLFNEGSNAYAYRFMGAHPETHGDIPGYAFAVWAPNARAVSLVGDFNGWNHYADPMEKDEKSGIWRAFKPLLEYTSYKYAIQRQDGGWQLKADPYAFHAETKPETASKTCDIGGYAWGDGAWMRARGTYNPYISPINIYEVHLGSWKRDEQGRYYTYNRIADELVPYVRDMGYTHVEIMPVMEHPLDLSWGYQVTGFFAPTSRFGSPKEFMALVDRFHQVGIGVLLDWVPAHFLPNDESLRRFDGTALYEHPDPRRGENKLWGTNMFNYARDEVRSFMLSSAMHWLDTYHADGLRVDAVSYMLYNDYGREPGDWLPNRYGGRENIEAIDFLRRLNELIYRDFPGVIVAAEEATSWPMVTKPTYLGGLGFGFKWNMGWMNDTLRYIKLDPILRKYKHSALTFSLMYAFNENFILPLSHDEVVHGKKSLLDKNPGDYWKQFAGLRALYGYTFAHPGKKLLFMGGEYGQYIEWKEEDTLDWFLLQYDMHRSMHRYVRALNRFYARNPALYEIDASWDGFTWLSADDADNSVVAFMRISKKRKRLICVCNFTPVYHPSYRFGTPFPGIAREVFNSDGTEWGGSGQGNRAPLRAFPRQWNNMPCTLDISLPPLSFVCFRFVRSRTVRTAPLRARRVRRAK